MKKFVVLAALMIAAFTSASAQVEQGWKVKMYGGYELNMIKATPKDNAAALDVVAGYQINDYVFVGLQASTEASVHSGFKGEGNPFFMFPLSVNFGLTIPTNSVVTPLIDINAGCSIFTAQFHNSQDAMPRDAIVSVLPGLAIRLGDHFSILGNVGYKGYFKMNDIAKTSHGVYARLGLMIDFE